MSNTKKILLITILSLVACGLHSLMLLTPVNQYAYTSTVKLVLFILCPLIFFAISKDGKLKDLFSLKGDKRYIKLSLIFAAVVFAFMLGLFALVRPLLDREMIVGALSNVGITGENYLFAMTYYIFINVALEELFFRGFLFSNLYRMDVKLYAYLFSSVLFAIYHISVMRSAAAPGVLIVAIIGLVAVGLLFNEITRRCKTVVGSYAVHFGASLAIGIIGAYYMYLG